MSLLYPHLLFDFSSSLEDRPVAAPILEFAHLLGAMVRGEGAAPQECCFSPFSLFCVELDKEREFIYNMRLVFADIY